MPSMTYLILSEVEGRTMPMRFFTMCANASPWGEDRGEGEQATKRMLPMIESFCGRLPLSIPLLRNGPLPLPSGRGKAYRSPQAIALALRAVDGRCRRGSVIIDRLRQEG